MTNTSDYIRKEATITGLSNMGFNGVIAWLLLRGGDALQWGGEHSFVIDLFATAFILPLIVALIIIPLQRRKVRQQKMPAMTLNLTSPLQGLVNRLPNSLFINSMLFGFAGALVFAPLALLVFWALGIEQVQPLNYAIFKGFWAGLMAAVLVVPMLMTGLRAEPQG